jgi:hypothetical protein
MYIHRLIFVVSSREKETRSKHPKGLKMEDKHSKALSVRLRSNQGCHKLRRSFLSQVIFSEHHTSPTVKLDPLKGFSLLPIPKRQGCICHTKTKAEALSLFYCH